LRNAHYAKQALHQPSFMKATDGKWPGFLHELALVAQKWTLWAQRAPAAFAASALVPGAVPAAAVGAGVAVAPLAAGGVGAGVPDAEAVPASHATAGCVGAGVPDPVLASAGGLEAHVTVAGVGAGVPVPAADGVGVAGSGVAVCAAPQRRRQLLLQAAAGGGGGGGGGGGSSGVLGRMQRWAAGAWAFVARRPPPPEVLWQGMHTYCASRMALSIWQASFCKAHPVVDQRRRKLRRRQAAQSKSAQHA